MLRLLPNDGWLKFLRENLQELCLWDEKNCAANVDLKLTTGIILFLSYPLYVSLILSSHYYWSRQIVLWNELDLHL